jgi:hypothetical protein
MAEAGTDHAAELSIRLGAGVTIDARVTSAGLLSIGALVSGILLSTAVVVHVAGRKTTGRARLSMPVVDPR